MATITKKDRARANSLIRRYETLESATAGPFNPDVNTLRQRVRSLADKCQENRIERILDGFNVELLSILGYSPAISEARGIDRMSQVPRHGKDDAGISNAEQAIIACVEKLRAKLREYVSCYPDASKCAAEDNELMVAVYQALEYGRVHEECAAIVRTIAVMKERLTLISSLPGPVKAFFMADGERRQLLSALDGIDSDLTALEDRWHACLSKYNAVAGVSSDEAWSEYCKQEAYYTRYMYNTFGAQPVQQLPVPNMVVLQQCLAVRDSANELRREFESVDIASKTELLERVTHLGGQVRRENAISQLADVSVDDLSLYGSYSIDACKQFGIESLADLVEMQDRTEVETVDRDTLRELCELANQLYQRLYDMTPCVFSQNETTPSADELVIALFAYQNSDQLGEMYNALAEGIPRLWADIEKPWEAYDVFDALYMPYDQRATFLESLCTSWARVNELNDDLRNLQVTAYPTDGQAWAMYQEQEDQLDDLVRQCCGGPSAKQHPCCTKDLQAMLNELDESNEGLRDQLESLHAPKIDDLDEQIRTIAQQIIGASLDDMCARIGLSALEPLGINVEPLTSEGITNVQQLHECQLAYLQDLLGNGQAKTTRHTIDEIRHGLRAKTPCLIDDATRPDEHRLLINRMLLRDIVLRVGDNRDSLLGRIDEDANTIDELKQRISLPDSLFVDLTTWQGLDGQARQLETEVDACSHEVGEFVRLINMDDVDEWQAYASNREAHDRSIASMSGACASAVLPLVTATEAVESEQMANRFDELRKSIKKIKPPTERTQANRMRRLAHEVREEHTRAIMDGVWVEQLGDFGFEPNVLVEAGYQATSDVWNADVASLSEIVGEEPAKQVFAASQSLHNALYDDMPCRIDLNRRDGAQVQLLGAVLEYESLGEAQETFGHIEEGLNSIERTIGFLKERPYVDRLVMTSDELAPYRESMENASQVLGQCENDKRHIEGLIVGDDDTSIESAFNAYEANQRQFDDLIARVAKSPQRATMPVVTVDLARRAGDIVERLRIVQDVLNTTKLPSQLAQGEAIRDRVDDLRREYACQLMSRLETESLTWAQIDPKSYVEKGLVNFLSLFDYLKGLAEPQGEESQVRTLCEAIEDEIRKETPFLLDSVNKPISHTKIVCALYTLIKTPQITVLRSKLEKLLEQTVDYRRFFSKKGGGTFSVSMSPYERDEFARTIQKLEDGMPAIEQTAHELSESVSFTAEDAWSAYARLNNVFERVLRSVAKAPKNDDLPQYDWELAVQAHRTLSYAQRIVNSAVSLEPPSEESLVDAIYSHANAIQDSLINELVSGLEVEALGPLGLDYKKFKAIGLEYAGQINPENLDINADELDAVERAEALHAVQRIADHLRGTVGLVIDPSKCTEGQTSLLRDAYLYRHRDSLAMEYAGLMQGLARCFPQREVLDSRIGFFGNLFVSEDRRHRILRAILDLDGMLPGLDHKVEAFEERCLASRQQLLAEYEEHSEEFDATIRRIANLPKSTMLPRPCGELARRSHDAVVELARLEDDVRNTMPPGEREQRMTICALSDAVREEYVLELLAQIPIGALAPSGIDVSACEACGLTDLARVEAYMRDRGAKKLDRYMLLRLGKVMGDVRNIVRDQTPCLIDDQNQPSSHSKLVAALVRFKHLPEMVRQREKLMDDVLELGSLGMAIESGPGYIANLFMNDERKARVVRCTDALMGSIANASLRLDALCRSLPDAGNVEASEEEWSEYLERRDFFDDLVHTVTGSPVGDELPAVTVDLALDGLWAYDRFISTRELLRHVRIADPDDTKDKVLREARNVRTSHMEHILSSMSVDVLKPLGVDVKELKSFGYANIQELRIAGAPRLRRQIGCESADDLQQHVDHIRGVVWNAVPCAIGVEPHDESQVRLVRALVVYDLIEGAKQEDEELHECDTACYEHVVVLGPGKGYLKNLCMTAERREEYLGALNSLKGALPDFARRTVELHYRTNNVPEYAWTAYHSDSEHYDAVLRSITNYSTRHSLPIITSDIALKAYSLLQRLGEIRNKLAELDVADPDDLTNDIEESIEGVREHEARASLRGVSIDSLANIKVRSATFRRAGFNTLEDLVDYDERELIVRHRINPNVAQKVITVVQGAYKSHYQHARCRIDSDNEPPHQVTLLERVYLYLLWQQLQERRDDLQDAGMSLNVEIDDLSGRFEYVSNLVMNEDRLADVHQRVSHVNDALPQLEEAVANLEVDVSIARNERPPKVWDDYRSRAATYDTIITELGGGTGELAYGDLPETLVHRVMAHPLDLSLMRQITLRDYQRFAARYTLLQQKVLVGDEMGLGKTIEALAVISHLAAQGESNFAIVCPLSVILNWEQEIKDHMRVEKKFILKPRTIYGPGRAREFKSWCLHGGIAITSYDMVGRLEWGWLRDRVSLVVVDEAHYIKNSKTRRAQAICDKLLPVSENILFLTGTPLENRLDEMNTIISYLDPQLVKRIPSDACVNPVAYREHVASVYLRRKRDDVLVDLPERIVKDDRCVFGGEDERDYMDALEDGNFSSMRRVGWRHDSMNKSAKAIRFLEIYREAKANGSKLLVFSFFLDTLAKVESLVHDDCAGVITGKLSGKKRQEIVDNFKDSEKSVLIAQVNAGGVGLNIQAASVVVFCEPQLKPSMEEQAIGRAHRMGQLHKVVVHRLLMAETVDFVIEDLLKKKRDDFNNYADISQIGQQSLSIIDSSVINEIIEQERKKHKVDVASGARNKRTASRKAVRHG